MNGQDVFSGSSEGPASSLFDLTDHAGKLLHLRFDFGSTREWQAVERWVISDAFVFASSTKPEIEIPDELALSSNFPDPFSSTTTIRFTVPEAMHVRIDVLNTLGQLVALLANGVHEKGTHTATFDGSHLASGLYLVVMDAGDQRISERMIIVR